MVVQLIINIMHVNYFINYLLTIHAMLPSYEIIKEGTLIIRYLSVLLIKVIQHTVLKQFDTCVVHDVLLACLADQFVLHVFAFEMLHWPVFLGVLHCMALIHTVDVHACTGHTQYASTVCINVSNLY